MSTNSILDVKALTDDLRSATQYASRAGLLREPAILERIEAADRGVGADSGPNVQALTTALNEVAQAIAPITLADLRFGRDPFDAQNQRRARIMQLWLAIVAVIALFMIGHSMHSLRTEQSGLQALQQLQAMQPFQKVTALRKIAQFDDPLSKPNSSSDLYHQKLGELVAMVQNRALIDKKMNDARSTAMFPWPHWPELFASAKSLVMAEPNTAADSAPGRVGIGPGSMAHAATLVQSPAIDLKDSSAQQSGGAPAGTAGSNDTAQDFCVRGRDGKLELPTEVTNRPDWVKSLKADSLDDFCFQYAVLTPFTGQINLANQDMGRLDFIPDIEKKVSLRSNWFLPFFFGVLGAIIFVMRNVASVRTPAMEYFPVLMRISLGGVAGIVMGWFSTAALPALESTSALSVPFALAFLTGYGIDALFGALDRLSRLAAGGSGPKAA